MAPRRIPRPVKVDPPSARAPFVDPATGVLTPHGLKAVSFLRDRTGGDYDSVWTALGVAVTGLTQINQVNQKVNDLEAATAVVQGAVAGLRGDPRLEDAVKALEIAIVALVQVQARASGESDRRISDLDRLVSSLGARLTKAQQAVQFQSAEVADESLSTQRLQTAFIQRVSASQGMIAREIETLQSEVENLSTTDVSEGANLYYTDGRARAAISGTAPVSVNVGTGVISLTYTPANLAGDTFTGTVTAPTLTSTGGVAAAGGSGFTSSTFASNARNPIWRFGNADAYGLSYFQGSSGVSGIDTIGVHFGTATSAGSPFTFISTGDLRIAAGFRFNPPTYADNAAALAGGLVATDTYKTATGELRIVV